MKERYPHINPIDDTIRRIENPLHDEMILYDKLMAIYKLGLKDEKNDVLDKIKVEIDQYYNRQPSHYPINMTSNDDVMQIINKYNWKVLKYLTSGK